MIANKNSFLLVPLVFVLIVGASVAQCETLAIPLDLITGNNLWNEQELDFDAGGQLVDLTEVRLQLSGQFGNQIYLYCMNFSYWNSLPSRIQISLLGAPETTALDIITQQFPDGPLIQGTYEWTFDLSSPENLAAISDGSGQILLTDLAVMFFSDTAGGFVCPSGPPCILDSGTLFLEFSQLVSDEPSTWDAIKAVYR